jgi:hypothetical protein
MRPLSSYRLKTANQTRKTTSSSSASTATRPSTKSSLNSQFDSNSRPNTNNFNIDNDPSDISDDISSLTLGPALQGSLLRNLMTRRTSKPGTPNKISHELTSRILPTYESTMKFLNNDIRHQQQNQKKSDPIENKELREELTNWRKDHTK